MLFFLAPVKKSSAETNVEEIIVHSLDFIPFSDTPKNISLITAADISLTPALNVAELLANEANISLRSFTGTEKSGGIDLRNSGDTSGSNILVLVDGIDINQPNLSGPDLSSISLLNIKQIEILRGGNSVQYGGGAVNGIINIITKPPQEESEKRLQLQTGTFNSNSAHLSFSQSLHNQHGLSVASSWSDSDGYRDNNKLKKKNILLNYIFSPTQSTQFKLISKFHKDKFGLPGPLERAALESNILSRKDSDGTESYGESTENNHAIYFSFKPEEKFSANFYSRYHTFQSDTLINLTPIIDDLSSYKTKLHIAYQLNQSINLIAGTDYTDEKYDRFQNGIEIEGAELKSGSLFQYGYYGEAHFKLKKSLKLSIGYRKHKASSNIQGFRYQQNTLSELCETTIIDLGNNVTIPVLENCPLTYTLDPSIAPSLANKWFNEAYEIGTLWNLTSKSEAYLHYSETFRLPNIDELILSDEDLKPQTGKQLETGIRIRNSLISFSANFFYIETTDEILLSQTQNGLNTLNFNSEEISIRQGGEIELKSRPSTDSTLSFNLGYTDAKFKMSNSKIPLTAVLNASSKLTYNLSSNFESSLTVRYESERFDGNDFLNGSNSQYKKLKPYTVFDAKLHYTHKDIALFIGINNLTNKKYETSAYSNSIYPMAGRSIFSGLTLTL